MIESGFQSTQRRYIQQHEKLPETIYHQHHDHTYKNASLSSLLKLNQLTESMKSEENISTETDNQRFCASPESGIESDQPISPQINKCNEIKNDCLAERIGHNFKTKLKTPSANHIDKSSIDSGQIDNCKRLFLRRIRSLNGELKKVLMVEADFDLVANEFFLRDRERMSFMPIVFSNCKAPSLPHKKRYFFSLSNLNKITKLKRKHLSTFKCNFEYSDSESEDEQNNFDSKCSEIPQSPSSLSCESNKSDTDDSPLSPLPCTSKTVGERDENPICSNNSILSNDNEWQMEVDADSFYASVWHPPNNDSDIMFEEDNFKQSEDQNEKNIDFLKNDKRDVKEEFEPPVSPVTPKPISKRLSKFEKLKLDLKKREMELEEVRRRNGLIS